MSLVARPFRPTVLEVYLPLTAALRARASTRLRRAVKKMPLLSIHRIEARTRILPIYFPTAIDDIFH